MNHQQPAYYVPDKSTWPLLGAVGLFCSVWGIASLLHQASYAFWLLGAGTCLIGGMMVGWFHLVIQESQAGLYNAQIDGLVAEALNFQPILYCGLIFMQLGLCLSIPILANI